MAKEIHLNIFIIKFLIMKKSIFAFAFHILSAQDSMRPAFHIDAGWRTFNTNLDKFNASLPDQSAKITKPLSAVELGMSLEFEKFMIHSDFSIGTRNRSYVSDYEQIIVSQTRWSISGGPVMNIGKKQNIQFATLAGIGYNSIDLRYRNDTLNKASSIPWVINQAPTQYDEDPRHYNNPGFVVLVEQRVSVIVRKHFMFTGFVGYQHDLGKGRWHYEYGFIRRNSPETFGSGLTYGGTLGLRFPINE